MEVQKIKDRTEVWYTKSHLLHSITNYIDELGYSAYKEENIIWGRTYILLFVFGKGYKEIIEIKGHLESFLNIPRHELYLATKSEAIPQWFSDSLNLALISLAKQYKNNKLPVSICLPDLLAYRQIINQAEEYFTSNNLHLYIYLVNKHGKVERRNLNAS
jgi:hypothetical protein